MMQVRRKKKPRPAKLIAYDFETTRIQVGTPRPLYLTAYGQHKGAKMDFEMVIRDFEHLTKILVNYFLIDELTGVKFVAWNANNFDAYFIAAALLSQTQFVMRPYLTRSNALRGLRVVHADDVDKENPRSWEFLDGMAQLGLVGVSLDKFLANFAPDFKKLKGMIDFEREEFDPSNKDHCAYARRDSVGLWHAMNRAQQILLEKFDQPLAVTMGGACIKILKAHIPQEVVVRTPKEDAVKVIRDYVMRGGYCYCVKRYQGPVWKYDINQAYASAMREARLPCGFIQHSTRGINKYANVYIARITATKKGNKIPFYYRTEVDGKMRSMFGLDEIKETWLTSIEIDQLKKEGWKVSAKESWFWEEEFNLKDYVDKLERGRMNAPGGPSGPEGTVYKNVGNHSYGKTVEQLEAVEYVLAADCPPGYIPYYGDELEPLEHIYYRLIEEPFPKDYHQPQIGAFITAHVRMVVRRAALLAPDAWLYADTDSVVFSSDVTAQLDIDPARYGAWKVEESGTHYQIIAKKVYAQIEGGKDFIGPPSPKLKRSAKGLNVRRLTPDDFHEWYEGRPPMQEQVQRNNFISVMRGLEMYRAQKRQGTRVEITT